MASKKIISWLIKHSLITASPVVFNAGQSLFIIYYNVRRRIVTMNDYLLHMEKPKKLPYIYDIIATVKCENKEKKIGKILDHGIHCEEKMNKKKYVCRRLEKYRASSSFSIDVFVVFREFYSPVFRLRLCCCCYRNRLFSVYYYVIHVQKKRIFIKWIVVFRNYLHKEFRKDLSVALGNFFRMMCICDRPTEPKKSRSIEFPLVEPQTKSMLVFFVDHFHLIQSIVFPLSLGCL